MTEKQMLAYADAHPNLRRSWFSGLCKGCGKDFYTVSVRRQFCSANCSSKYNGKIGKVGGDMTSLAKFISLHGEKEGARKYAAYTENLSKRRIGCPGFMLGKKLSPKSKRLISVAVSNDAYRRSIRGKSYDQIRGVGSAEALSKKMKGTFSKEWFIEKYGEIEGNKLYGERCVNIQEKGYFTTHKVTSKESYSKISQKLFWAIYKGLPSLKKVYFAELNHEHSCGIARHQFDFVVVSRRKVIEFHGDRYHGNPERFHFTDKPHPYNKQLTALEMWQQDGAKVKLLNEKGYKVLTIWEKDFKEAPELVLAKCLEFLNEQ